MKNNVKTYIEYRAHNEHLANYDIHRQHGQHLTNGSEALVGRQGSLLLQEGDGVLQAGRCRRLNEGESGNIVNYQNL